MRAIRPSLVEPASLGEMTATLTSCPQHSFVSKPSGGNHLNSIESHSSSHSIYEMEREALVNAVRDHPIIWDYTHRDHKNLTKIDQAWERIAAELEISGEK